MSKDRSRARNELEFAAYRLARGATRVFSPAALAVVGTGLGSLFWRLGRSRRRIIDFNLRLAFPELDQDRRNALGLKVSRHFARALLDAIRIQRLNPEQILSEVTVHGGEHLEELGRSDHGGFLLSAHIGSWEVAALVAGLRLPGGLWVINRPLDNPILDRELVRLRGQFGNRALGKARVAREILERLRAGGIVGILIDQKVRPPSGLEVPFFGQPARTHTILARLVRRTGVPVVPTWALWEAPGRYSVHFAPPIRVDELVPSELEDGPLTTRFNRVVEEIIRSRPEQWLWFHDRWRQLRLGNDGR